MLGLRSSQDFPLSGRLSALGLLLGALCFAASLTPSMIPRTGLMQGVLGGLCFGAGYMIGAGIVSLWRWLVEAPRPRPEWQGPTMIAALIGAALAITWALWNVTEWQNGINAVMGKEPVESARPFTILAVAAALGVILVLIGRLFRRVILVVAAQLEPFVPKRIALFFGLVVAGLLFWMVGNDVVLGRVLSFLDRSYAAIDSLQPNQEPAPLDALKVGSAASLVSWDSLGAEGRSWVLSGPDQAQISDFYGAPAKEPLRVYVGMNSAETAEERAQLALQEAIRIGAFDREYLVIATPTGTGWMDPAGMQPLDYLTKGDVATIAMQYSYLPSWLSLMVQPEYGSESARALFHAVHSHWRILPEATRPKLYLFGLSLGARNAEIAPTLPELIAAPPQGALFVGPPFAAAGVQSILAARSPGSLAWAPEVGDGSMIRIRTQAGPTERVSEEWGPTRVVILEYPSDPIVFFRPDVFYKRPDWLAGPRAPDVSEQLGWYPVVTFFQLIFDMMTATTAPSGYGHVYSEADYLGAWVAVLGIDPPAGLQSILKERVSP